MSGQVRIFEVSPRDGLQNEPEHLPLRSKIDLVEGLAEAGLTEIEVGSFVRPKWIPQLADSAELLARLGELPGTTLWTLVPNRIGLERALDAGARAVATFLSASETHNRKNINRTIRESLLAQRGMIELSKSEGLMVRSYISASFGCSYEGSIAPGKVTELAASLLDAGADMVSLGDTTGLATPHEVRLLLEHMVSAGLPLPQIALHMHDTRGTALANVLTGLELGVRNFDSSLAGLGGCPYAPGASGNLATEDLIYMLEGMGYSTGVDLERLAALGCRLEAELGRSLPGRYHRYAQGQLASEQGTGT